MRFLACCLCVLSTVFCAVPASAAVSIVAGGKATAVVVTADKPLPVAAHAARELIQHVKKATGVTLPIATESKIPEGFATRVFLGTTKAAQQQGIDVETLRPEEFVMRSIGSDLYIVGKEGKDNPLSPSNSKCGTLFGVYEFLERYVGVRWIGSLG